MDGHYTADVQEHTFIFFSFFCCACVHNVQWIKEDYKKKFRKQKENKTKIAQTKGKQNVHTFSVITSAMCHVQSEPICQNTPFNKQWTNHLCIRNNSKTFPTAAFIIRVNFSIIHVQKMLQRLVSKDRWLSIMLCGSAQYRDLTREQGKNLGNCDKRQKGC